MKEFIKRLATSWVTCVGFITTTALAFYNLALLQGWFNVPIELFKQILADVLVIIGVLISCAAIADNPTTPQFDLSLRRFTEKFYTSLPTFWAAVTSLVLAVLAIGRIHEWCQLPEEAIKVTLSTIGTAFGALVAYYGIGNNPDNKTGY